MVCLVNSLETGTLDGGGGMLLTYTKLAVLKLKVLLLLQTEHEQLCQ